MTKIIVRRLKKIINIVMAEIEVSPVANEKLRKTNEDLCNNLQ